MLALILPIYFLIIFCVKRYCPNYYYYWKWNGTGEKWSGERAEWGGIEVRRERSRNCLEPIAILEAPSIVRPIYETVEKEALSKECALPSAYVSTSFSHGYQIANHRKGASPMHKHARYALLVLITRRPHIHLYIYVYDKKMCVCVCVCVLTHIPWTTFYFHFFFLSISGISRLGDYTAPVYIGI